MNESMCANGCGRTRRPRAKVRPELCDSCKQRERRAERRKTGGCEVEGCSRTWHGGRWCPMHYRRVRMHGDPGPVEATRRPIGSGTISPQGYVVVGGGKRNTNRLQHRVVMEQMLGRPLVDGETVHHKNGVRHDNRPENLELWVTTRPGQRVPDMVAWIVEQYPEQVREALAARS